MAKKQSTTKDVKTPVSKVEAPKQAVSKPQGVKVKATVWFYDMVAGSERCSGDEWETTEERANALKALGFIVVL